MRESVLVHAEREQHTVFGPLGELLDSRRLEQLGERYDRAKAAAPTRPHPRMPDTPRGNLVIGPVAALVDRVHEALRRMSQRHRHLVQAGEGRGNV